MEVEFNPDGKTPVSRCGAEQCFTNSAEITPNYGRVVNDPDKLFDLCDHARFSFIAP